MSLKTWWKILLNLQLLKLALSEESPYFQFMKLLYSKSSVQNFGGCLLGELYSSHTDSVDNFWWWSTRNPPFSLFRIELSRYDITKRIQSYWRLSESVRRYTQSCYIQIHHLTSYYQEFLLRTRIDKKSKFADSQFTFLRIFRSISKSSSPKGHVSQASLAILFFEKHSVKKKFINRFTLYLSTLNFDATTYALLNSFTLMKICFVCNAPNEDLHLRTIHIADTRNSENANEINSFLLESSFALKFKLKKISLNKMEIGCQFGSNPGKGYAKTISSVIGEFNRVFPLLFFTVADYFNFTCNTRKTFIRKEPSLQVWYNSIFNRRNVESPRQTFSITDVETYCSHNQYSYKVKLFLRKQRASLAVLEAIQQPLDRLTWVLLLISSVSGVFVILSSLNTYQYLVHSKIDVTIGTIGIYQYYQDRQYYRQFVDHGEMVIHVLNHGGHIKSLFHATLAWIDNCGIYKHIEELEGNWKQKFCVCLRECPE